MIRVPGGARLSFSVKDFGATPSTPQESDPARGRSLLAYPQRFDGLADVGLADGTRRDLRAYPWAEGQEDFLTLFDPPEAGIGWSAAVAAADGFVFFAAQGRRRPLPDLALDEQRRAPLSRPGRRGTGRCSASRRATAHFGDGRLVSAAANALSAAGYRTALPLGGERVVRYALGAIPVPDGWREVADIALGDGALTLTDVGGGTARVPFDASFLDGR